MPHQTTPAEHDQRSESRLSGVAIASAFCMLAWILWRVLENAPLSITLVGFGLTLLVVYQAVPASRARIVSAFETLTFPIRWLATLAVLAFVYFIVLLPIAIWYRATGKSIVARHPNATSNWTALECSDEPESYFKTF